MERDRLIARLRRIEDTFELRDDHDRAAIIEAMRAEDEELREAAKEAAASAMVDSLATDLIALLNDAEASGESRGDAAIALGPALELCLEAQEDKDFDAPLSPEVYQEVERTLKTIYHDAAAPTVVRRRALEAAVRSPQDWQQGAIRSAWQSGDDEWRLTAVFCMGQIAGFKDELLAAMQEEDIDLRCEAIFAAAEADLEEAGPAIIALAKGADIERGVRMAAIQALAVFSVEGAAEVLEELSDHEDEEIAELAQEAHEAVMFGDDFDEEFGDLDLDDDDDDDDDGDDDDDDDLDDEDFDDDDFDDDEDEKKP